MSFNRALGALYDGLNASDEAYIVSWAEVQEWADDALGALIGVGLIETVSKARSIECVACEYRCVKDVILMQHGERQRAMIVCEEPEMQSEMGRVNVPIEHLQRWQCSFEGLAKVMQRLLDLDAGERFEIKNSATRLGMLTGQYGRRWVSLQQHPLVLEVNAEVMPIDEVLFFEGVELCLDDLRIETALNTKQANTSKRYQPSIIRLEARKTQTQAMYQDWKDAATRLMRENPGQSKTWVSIQIAKMPIAQGKSAATIVRNIN